jgi:hypothetical protein
MVIYSFPASGSGVGEVLYGMEVVTTVSVSVALPSVSTILAKTSWPSILPQSCEEKMCQQVSRRI